MVPRCAGRRGVGRVLHRRRGRERPARAVVGPGPGGEGEAVDAVQARRAQEDRPPARHRGDDGSAGGVVAGEPEAHVFSRARWYMPLLSTTQQEPSAEFADTDTGFRCPCVHAGRHIGPLRCDAM